MLSENIHIRASISKELDSNLLVLAIAGTPEAKVQSRLLSSKTLATQVAVAVEDLKAVIQPDRRDGLQREAEDVDDSNADIPERHEKAKTATRAELDDEGMDNVAEGKCDDSFEDEGGGLETKADDAGWESVAIGSEDGAEDGWESGSISDERAKEHSKLTSEGDSDDDDSDQNPQVEHAKAKRRISAIAKATPKVTGTTSTFLPSLSVGFTRGDSDGSEFSDGEAVESYQKKNRRGQRARRACVLNNLNYFSILTIISASGKRSTGRTRITGRWGWKLRKPRVVALDLIEMVPKTELF
jgi:hypothetical protein